MWISSSRPSSSWPSTTSATSTATASPPGPSSACPPKQQQRHLRLPRTHETSSTSSRPSSPTSPRGATSGTPSGRTGTCSAKAYSTPTETRGRSRGNPPAWSSYSAKFRRMTTGSLLELVLLLLAFPAIAVTYVFVSKALAIQMLIYISYSGLKVKDIELASRTVLPHFYARDVRAESYAVFEKCERKVIITANPTIMVEPFVKEFLGGDKATFPAKSHQLFQILTIDIFTSIRANAKCAFEAIFIFGDSNSDTGGFYAAFPSQSSPYGMTYFNKPTGRSSDGRIFVDFLAQGLGLPFVSPYLQSIGSDFKHGANFATSASTILQPQSSLFVNGVSPFYLQVQVNQMRNFKSKVEELQSQGQTNLPQPDVFGKSLYVINIGQNDFTGYASSGGAGGVKQIMPQLVSQIVGSVKELYYMGGRTFMVHNLAPVGCYPAFIVQFPHESSDIDSSGCLGSYNNAVNEYNSMLKDALAQARQELKDANIIYVDTYSVLLDLIQNPTKHGLQHGTTACCGYGGGSYNFNQEAFCGSGKSLKGNHDTSSACSDPQNYVSWDGVHLTEAGSKTLAYGILSGSYFDPGFSLNQYCDIQPIG